MVFNPDTMYFSFFFFDEYIRKTQILLFFYVRGKIRSAAASQKN